MAMTEIPGREAAPHPEGVSPWPSHITEDDRPAIGPITLALFSVFALIAALFSIVLYATDDHRSPAAGAAAGTGATKTFDIQLGDLFVKPSAIDISAGDHVVLKVKNGGQMTHNLKLNGTTGTRDLRGGESARADLGAITQSVKAWCTIPGHKEAGMVLDIRVKGAAASAATTSATTAAATIDPNAAPGPNWHAFDPALQPAPAATVHNVELSATESEIEVAPGVTQQLWTFNGQYPGPTLRGHVGDVFNVKLTNNGTMGHSIDFHASQTSMDVNMRTIQPGESLMYQFKADYAGVWMYHCGTAPALHHIGNGMFGTVIIDPPNLAPVDHEYLFVQSELYLGPNGGPGDLTKMQNADFDAVVFNGYVNQYTHQPIQVQPGDRIRAYVLDAGPNENSSFHVVGTIFDTVYKEGAYLLRAGNADRGGSQALDLMPAQGGFVEFTVSTQGKYAMVTHKFANPGKGALGFFQAGAPMAMSGPMSH